MKILVIGNGGREYSLCKSFQLSKDIDQVYAIPGSNAWSGIESFPNIDILDFIKIRDTVKEHSIDLVFVGPEAPIIAGIKDYFDEHNINSIAPTKFCSQIESSKVFSKHLMNLFKVPTAKSSFAVNYPEYKNQIKEFSFPVVLKSDNPAFGKGVLIAKNMEEADEYANKLLIENLFGSKNKILIEEYLEGKEFSLMCLVNKDKVIALPPVCDHKTINDGDKGQMTGGMGVFNNPKFLTPELINKCIKTCIMPIVNGLKDSNPYYGVLFAGLMLTKQNELKVLEYNVRFGDPETEIILPLIKGDFFDIINQFYLENKVPKIEYCQHNAIGIVVAANKYPGEYVKNIDLSFINNHMADIIPMGINKDSQGKLISSGGRIFMYYKISEKKFNSLYKDIYKELNSIIPKNIKSSIHYRKDIGKKNI